MAVASAELLLLQLLLLLKVPDCGEARSVTGSRGLVPQLVSDPRGPGLARSFSFPRGGFQASEFPSQQPRGRPGWRESSCGLVGSLISTWPAGLMLTTLALLDAGRALGPQQPAFRQGDCALVPPLPPAADTPHLPVPRVAGPGAPSPRASQLNYSRQMIQLAL